MGEGRRYLGQIMDMNQSEKAPVLPAVSVVLVACNVERYLAEAMESILHQTFRDFEFVVIDFGSSDASARIISSYAEKDSRIRFCSIPHCGLSEARNAGCARARGKYIAIMDADDVSLPDRLKLQLEFMESHPEVGVLGGAVECIDATGKPFTIWRNPSEDQEIQTSLWEQCSLFQPTAFMRREAFSEIGGYRSPLAPAEDYDLWLRIGERSRLANLPQVVVQYRVHPSQVSMRRRLQQTFGILAARVSALERRKGKADPLNPEKEITQEELTSLGVTTGMLQRELVIDMERSVRNLCSAGEHSVALLMALDVLQTDLSQVEGWRICNIHIAVAQIYWKQKKVIRSFGAVIRAVSAYPPVVLRPVKRRLMRDGKESSTMMASRSLPGGSERVRNNVPMAE